VDLPAHFRDSQFPKIYFAELEGYDDSVKYPESLSDFCTRQANILAADYVDNRKGWSDPCPKFCPVCKAECQGRDEDKHPSTLGVHGCGKHCWHEDNHGKIIVVRRISIGELDPIDNSDLRELLTQATQAASR